MGPKEKKDQRDKSQSISTFFLSIFFIFLNHKRKQRSKLHKQNMIKSKTINTTTNKLKEN